MKDVVAANLRRPLHRRVRVQHATVAKFHSIAHHSVRTDLHARAKFRRRRHHRLQMDVRNAHALGSSAFDGCFGSRSTILHMSMASAASCPSTVARPSSLAKSPRQESTLISSFS
jgi:hypothetical protein